MKFYAVFIVSKVATLEKYDLYIPDCYKTPMRVKEFLKPVENLLFYYILLQ